MKTSTLLIIAGVGVVGFLAFQNLKETVASRAEQAARGQVTKEVGKAKEDFSDKFDDFVDKGKNAIRDLGRLVGF